MLPPYAPRVTSRRCLLLALLVIILYAAALRSEGELTTLRLYPTRTRGIIPWSHHGARPASAPKAVFSMMLRDNPPDRLLFQARAA